MFGQAFAFSGQLNAIQVLLCNLLQHLTNPRQTLSSFLVLKVWQPQGCLDCDGLGYRSQPFLVGPHHEYPQMRKILKQKSQKLFWTETHFHGQDVT